MSKIVLRGNTSGQTTIQSSENAGSTTITIPAADDTLVGKNTNDILTNKTINTSNNNFIFTPGDVQIDLSVDNLNTLKNMSKRPSTILMEGYANPGDGGGGSFYWDAASSQSPDDVFIIQMASGGTGRYKRIYYDVINPEWFGAKGDDSTDDTASLQAAIDATIARKVKLVLLAKTYKTTSRLTISNHNVTIEGANNGGSVIKIYSTTDDAIHVNEWVNSYYLRNFKVDRVGNAISGSGIFIGNASPGYIDLVSADNHFYGFSLGAVAYSQIINCMARHNWSHGFNFFNTSDPNFRPSQWEVSNCLSEMNNGWGFYFLNQAINCTMGSWHHANTYANGLGGIGIFGQSDGRSINDLVLMFVISSTNGNDGVRIDPFGGGNNRINGCFSELSGTETTGRNKTGVPQSNLGCGIRIAGSADLSGPGGTPVGWVQITDSITMLNSEEGYRFSVDMERIACANIQSQANCIALSSNKYGVNLLAPLTKYSISNVTSGNFGFWTSQDYGINAATSSNVSVVGGEYFKNTIAPVTSWFPSSNVTGDVVTFKGRSIHLQEDSQATTFNTVQFNSILENNIGIQHNNAPGQFYFSRLPNGDIIYKQAGPSLHDFWYNNVSKFTVGAFIQMKNLPTTNSGLPSGGVWNYNGILSTNPQDTIIPSLEVQTLAELKALTVRPTTVEMQYRSVANDGGGGKFRWYPGDSTIPDDALIVQPTSGAAGRYKRMFVPGEYYAAWWGVVGDGVTSCDAAMKAAAASAKGGMLYLPRGRILLTGTDTVHLVNIRMTGMGALNWSNADTDDYVGYQHLGDFGSTFLITSTTQQPFTVDNSVTIEHCNFFWPNQTGQTAAPIVYPPLITDRGVNYDNTGGVANNIFINCSVINAYDFLKQSTQALTWGSWRILCSDIYAIRRVFSLATIAEQFMIAGCVFNMSLYFEGVATVFTGGISNGSGGSGTILNVSHVNSGHIGLNSKTIGGGTLPDTTITAYLSGTGLTGTYTVTPTQFTAPGTNFFFAGSLGLYTRANGDWLHVWGDGTPSQASSTLVGGLAGTNNIVYGYRRGIFVDTGCLDFATFDSSHHFDGSPQVLYVGNSGSVTHTRILGSYYSFPFFGDAVNLPCFELDNPAGNGPTGGSNIEINGDLRGGNGTFFRAVGTNINRIELSNLSVGNWGVSSTAGNYYAAFINAANADVRISSSYMSSGSAPSQCRGITVSASKSLLIEGVKIVRSYNPIEITGNTGRIFITGCQTSETVSTYSVVGTLGDNLSFGINDFDKSYSYLDGTTRIGSSGISVYIASQGPSIGNAPYVGYNIWQNENGTWRYGKGSVASYGALIRLDAGAGNLGFFMSSATGAAGATATMNQSMYLSASDGTTYLAGPVRALSAFRAQGVATTASAANAFLDSGDANNLLRSTSSLRYKTDVEPLDISIAKTILYEVEPIWYRSTSPADRSDWSWYGFSAENVAEVDPRLVFYGYTDDDYEYVEISPERTEIVELSDGTETTVVYPANIEKRLKIDAVKVPDGVMYERFTTMHHSILKEHEDIIKKQQQDIDELKALVQSLLDK